MELYSLSIMILLIIGAIVATTTKNILGSIIMFAVYSLMMAILWGLLLAPDLAITEAAVGAGVTTILFVLTLRRIKGGLK